MISLQNVTREFQLAQGVVITPVRQVSLDIDNGELIIIIGRSGSGKTTLLNLCAGLIKPTSGQVLFDNINLGNMNDRQLSTWRNQKIGFIFQFPSLIPALTVEENVVLPALFKNTHGLNGLKESAINILSSLSLKDKLDMKPRQLSAGEQKRAVIARAMINQPKIILADEPTSDLDERTENEVMEMLRGINATGVSFVIVTHSLGLLAYATRAFEMDGGILKDITGRRG